MSFRCVTSVTDDVKKLGIISFSVFWVSVAIETYQAVNRRVQGVFESQWTLLANENQVKKLVELREKLSISEFNIVSIFGR